MIYIVWPYWKKRLTWAKSSLLQQIWYIILHVHLTQMEDIEIHLDLVLFYVITNWKI